MPSLMLPAAAMPAVMPAVMVLIVASVKILAMKMVMPGGSYNGRPVRGPVDKNLRLKASQLKRARERARE